MLLLLNIKSREAEIILCPAGPYFMIQSYVLFLVIILVITMANVFPSFRFQLKCRDRTRFGKILMKLMQIVYIH